jgi:protein gp37
MGDTTGIGWTDKTWNPWHGCTKVSPGCAHCYMYRDKARYGQDPETVVRSKTTFRAPLKWKEPARVFTCSWSDFFHKAADDWRTDAWDVIRQTPHLTYQVLTKRPERIASHLPEDWGRGWPNVWLGVSVENQRWAERVGQLAAIPAAVRFVSAEPLLGPVTFRWAPWQPFDRTTGEGTNHLDGLRNHVHWVIVGGESGPDHRPMREEWARTLRDQCAEAGVAFYLKQLGGWPDARAHEKAVLDGRTYTEFPVLVEVETP